MAITDLTSATAVNVVLNWLLPASLPRGGKRVPDHHAFQAMEHLATEAKKKLGAGVSARAIQSAIAVDGARLAVLATPRACRVCNCTQHQACPGGCTWVEEDLCSACVGKEP